MTATHTGPISAAKPRKDTEGRAGTASRFVRFETGSSNEALLARRTQACTDGRGMTRVVEAAAATTGVSRTTVASRLSAAVVSDAATKVRASMRWALPRLSRAT